MKRNLWKDKVRARVPETHSREKYAVNQEIEHLSLQILDLSSHDLDNHPRNRVSFKRDDKNRTFPFSYRRFRPPFIERILDFAGRRGLSNVEAKKKCISGEKFPIPPIFSRNENRCWRKKERKLTFVQFLLRSSQVTITCFHLVELKFSPCTELTKTGKIECRYEKYILQRKESRGRQRDPLPLPLPIKALKFSKYR